MGRSGSSRCRGPARPTASAVAALTNAVYAAPNAVCIHLMRRDAPHPQRRSTSWLDQSMVLAVALGLVLHLSGPAPSASHWVLVVAGPVLAFVGAALYTGSVLHPHNASVDRAVSTIGDGCSSAVRVGYLLAIAIITNSSVVAVIAILSALGPPAFNPPQQAVLYGYRSGVVMVAVRWGCTLSRWEWWAPSSSAEPVLRRIRHAFEPNVNVSAMSDYVIPEPEPKEIDERLAIELGHLADNAVLKGKPSGNEKCENCRYFFEPYKDLSYCWHPKLRILVGSGMVVPVVGGDPQDG